MAVGHVADLVVIDPAETFTLEAGDLHQRHKTSPYVGATFRGRVRRTIRRGETIFLDGRITARSLGRLVRPHDHRGTETQRRFDFPCLGWCGRESRLSSLGT